MCSSVAYRTMNCVSYYELSAVELVLMNEEVIRVRE